MDETMSTLPERKCKTVRDLIREWDGPGSPSDDPILGNHLAHCPSCRKAFMETREILNLWRRDRLPERDPAFWKGMSARIMTEVRSQPPKPVKEPWYRKIWEAPFQWPGYAWATAVLLFVLTPLAIYTIQDKGKTAYPGMEISVSQLRGEFGFEPYISTLESFSAQEADRLGKKVVARLGKELIDNTIQVDEDLGGDLPVSLDNLSPKELDSLIQKLQTGGAARSKEEQPDVA